MREKSHLDSFGVSGCNSMMFKLWSKKNLQDFVVKWLDMSEICWQSFGPWQPPWRGHQLNARIRHPHASATERNAMMRLEITTSALPIPSVRIGRKSSLNPCSAAVAWRKAVGIYVLCRAHGDQPVELITSNVSPQLINGATGKTIVCTLISFWNAEINRNHLFIRVV